ncbi:MAG TPA: hypothetical protein VL098_08465 [Flavipsychrobacter sp.]|nr:hypothetical protein [Flavipsychrobacter sp.]
MSVFNRISQSAGTNLPATECGCAQCPYRFDPLLNREEAWAYTGFKPGTLAVWDCTRSHDLQPIKFANAVRYRLSSLNRLADARIRP